MATDAGPLRMFGTPTDAARLAWAWVDDRLVAADVYWIVAAAADRARARPVWGVWRDEHVVLSIGSPRVKEAIGPGSPVTVHLGDGLDVVIVEGHVSGPTDDRPAIADYDVKYDWEYRVDRYGPLTVIAPDIVMAWRSAGPAGRDGFRATGRWRFPR